MIQFKCKSLESSMLLNKNKQKVKEKKPTALAFLKRLQSVQIYPHLSGANVYIKKELQITNYKIFLNVSKKGSSMLYVVGYILFSK